MINCPYNEFEIKIASLGMMKKIEAMVEEKGEDYATKLMHDLANEIGTEAPKKPEIAAYHGISVETLINSPNYDKLYAEFMQNRTNRAISLIKEKLDMDDKQAWALICHGAL